MFVTNDDALFEKVLTLSNHGRSSQQKKQFWPDLLGYKFKMSNVQAALGCAQLERVDLLVERKREILHRYRTTLSAYPSIQLNPEPVGTVNGAWMPNVVFDPKTRISTTMLQAAFAADNIDARVFFYPLSSLPMFGSHHGQKNASDIAQRAINLPSYHDMSNDEQERVTAILIQLLDRHYH